MSSTVSHTHSLETRPLARLTEDIAEGEGHHEDIYRGEPPDQLDPVNPHLQARPPSVISLPSSSSSSSSSSSGWSILGLRRGALGAVLEMAINRWARATSGSSTASSSSSASSVHTRRRRPPRRPSIATSTQNLHSENIIRARLRARGEGRALPREFTLFLPKKLAQHHIEPRRHHRPDEQQQQGSATERGDESLLMPYQDKARRNFQSTSLQLTLTRLDAARKRSAKLWRKQGSPSPGYPLNNAQDGIIRDVFNGKGKGKGKKNQGTHNGNSNHPRMMDASDIGFGGKAGLGPKPAWWLDVSSPTWSDMREIGKMLHLHPLTLEDILHQETREKLELFPRLGYYFIVFRALESDRTRAKATQLSLNLSANGDGKNMVPISRGSMGATNVYIAVFRDGICTFHFEDIADHTLHVRNRIMQLEGTLNMTSDWIAHGLLDSIVDQFFPLLNTIEREVKELDDLVLSIEGSSNAFPPMTDSEVTVVAAEPKKKHEGEKAKSTTEHGGLDVSEKGLSKTRSSSHGEQTELGPTSKHLFSFSWLRRLASFLFSLSGVFQRLFQKFWRRRGTRIISLKHHIQLVPSSLDALLAEGNDNNSLPPLTRMATTRRLVTSLTRLLGTKGEVVSRIRKRLAGVGLAAVYYGEGITENGLDAAAIVHATAEVGIYLDDIQDHIQTLHQALAHYEHILSHSHPAYLSHLRLSHSQARGGADKAVILLSVMSVGIAATQVVTGIFSMNVGKIPRNTAPGDPRHPGGKFTAFGGVLVAVTVVALLVVAVTRWWWILAGKKFKRGRTERGF